VASSRQIPAPSAHQRRSGAWQYTTDKRDHMDCVGLGCQHGGPFAGIDASTWSVRAQRQLVWTVDPGPHFRPGPGLADQRGRGDTSNNGGATAFSTAVETAQSSSGTAQRRSRTRCRRPPARWEWTWLRTWLITFNEAATKGRERSPEEIQRRSTVETIDVSSSAVSVVGDTVTIDPATTLLDSTGYYVQVPAGAFRDLAGTTCRSHPVRLPGTSHARALVVADLASADTGFAALFQQRSRIAALLNLYDQAGALGAADMTMGRHHHRSGPGLAGRGPGLAPSDLYQDRRRVGAGHLCGDAAQWSERVPLHRRRLLDGDGNGTNGDDYVTTFVSRHRPRTRSRSACRLHARLRPAGESAGEQPVGGTALKCQRRFHRFQSRSDAALQSRLVRRPEFLTGPAVEARGVSAVFNVLPPGTATLTNHSTGGGQPECDRRAARGRRLHRRGAGHGPLRAKQVLELADLHVYDLAASRVELPAIDDDAMHLAAYFGDTNGGKSYNLADAILVQRVLVSLATGFPAFQMADPILDADITSTAPWGRTM